MWSAARHVPRSPHMRTLTKRLPRALHVVQSETSDERRPSRRRPPVATHARATRDVLSWRRCAHELKAAESNRTIFVHREARIRQHRPDVRKVDMTVTMEMREDPVPALWPAEIDDEQSTARFQHPADLSGALMADLSGQVMQHHGAEHRIESCIRKGERLHERLRECDVGAGSG